MIVLVDNGHGVNTKGKRSPDGRLREYLWAREVADRIVRGLTARGIEARRIVPEDTDVSLTERVRRVNAECKRRGANGVLLLSIHNNAAGSGGAWMQARGWTAWVYNQAGERARRLAAMLQTEAMRLGLRGDRYVPACRYYTAGFYILKHTACAAVLTENLFQDNREDVAYLLSEEGKETLVGLHVDVVCEFLKGC